MRNKLIEMNKAIEEIAQKIMAERKPNNILTNTLSKDSRTDIFSTAIAEL